MYLFGKIIIINCSRWHLTKLGNKWAVPNHIATVDKSLLRVVGTSNHAGTMNLIMLSKQFNEVERGSIVR